jgi:hypothetical protein
VTPPIFTLYFSLIPGNPFRGDRFDGDCVRHHAFRPPKRFPGHPALTAPLAELFGVSFVSAGVFENFSGMFRRLSLAA